MKHAFALAAATMLASAAMAGPAPYPKPSSFATGSYSQSCDSPHFSNNWSMSAFCNKPKEFMKKQQQDLSTLKYMGCDAGSISNDNGILKCTRSDGSLMTHMALQNSQAVRAASLIVMGVDPEWATLQKWYAYGWKTNPAFKSADLDFSTAALVLRDYLTKAASMDEVHAVENAAYQQVNGKPWVQPGGIQVWAHESDIRSGKTWYAPLVLDMKKAKASPPPPSTAPQPPIH